MLQKQTILVLDAAVLVPAKKRAPAHEKFGRKNLKVVCS